MRFFPILTFIFSFSSSFSSHISFSFLFHYSDILIALTVREKQRAHQNGWKDEILEGSDNIAGI